jgi:hypothetical protein
MATACFECNDAETTRLYLLDFRFRHDGKLMYYDKAKEAPCPYCKPDELEEWWRHHIIEFL